jgi:F-type H+-transporting ATPase subunit b
LKARKQISHRASHFILLMALILGTAVAPLRAVAQDAAPAAPQAESQGHSQAQPKPESVFKQEHKAEKAEEEDETAAYRHSASVQWIANLLHLDVETAAKIFEYINFAVGIPIAKVLPAAMRKRSAKLSADLEVAQAKTQDANDRLKAVEEKLAGLDSEIAAIRKQVEEQMRDDEARSKTILEEETARIVAGAEQEIVVAAAQAQRGLKQFAADLAIDRAMSQLTIDAETDRALFAEFAHDIAGKSGKRQRAKGDQN